MCFIRYTPLSNLQTNGCLQTYDELWSGWLHALHSHSDAQRHPDFGKTFGLLGASFNGHGTLRLVVPHVCTCATQCSRSFTCNSYSRQYYCIVWNHPFETSKMFTFAKIIEGASDCIFVFRLRIHFRVFSWFIQRINRHAPPSSPLSIPRPIAILSLLPTTPSG